MIIDHFFKGKELRVQCFYCGEDLTKFRWVSFQYSNTHYKQTKCNCGKKHEVTEKFLTSSGHDDWDGRGWIGKDELDELNERMKSDSLEDKLSEERKR